MNLQTRVINILSKPAQEWPVIASESTDVAALYKEYIIPLAAIPAICGFLGMRLIGVTPMVSGLASLIVGYVLSLVGIFLAAFIVDKPAPSFQSRGGIVHALKMVAFASTPSWVAGVLQLVPLLGVLALLAAPSGVFLFFLGPPSGVQTPPDNVIPSLVGSSVVIIVISVVTASISGIFMSASRMVL